MAVWPLSNPSWSDFDAYRSFKERGLRREALERLDSFIGSMSECSFTDRKEFVCWLFSTAEDIQFLPHPLRARLVDPLLREWIEQEPEDSRPRLWLGSIPDLWEAHRLDPSNPEIRLQLVKKVLKGIDYEMHELPRGFLGDDVEGCFAALLRLHQLLFDISKSPEADSVLQEIEGRNEVLSNLIAYQRDVFRDYDETFETWCARLGRRGRW